MSGLSNAGHINHCRSKPVSPQQGPIGRRRRTGGITLEQRLPRSFPILKGVPIRRARMSSFELMIFEKPILYRADLPMIVNLCLRRQWQYEFSPFDTSRHLD